VDFAHRLDAGTKGTVTLTTSSDPGVVRMFLIDENENGQFDGTDRALAPGDLGMDPDAGKDHLALLLRLFVPASSPIGATHRVTIDAVQAIEGTPLIATAQATDAVVVVDDSIGLVTLHKEVDTNAAAPGEIVTYTVSFTNTGVDSVQNVLVFDPVSVYVDPVADAFGPGMDVEWHKDGATVVYLTLDPTDGDECDFSGSDRLLRLTFSKNTPYYLGPGETGELTYKVLVK